MVIPFLLKMSILVTLPVSKEEAAALQPWITYDLSRHPVLHLMTTALTRMHLRLADHTKFRFIVDNTTIF